MNKLLLFDGERALKAQSIEDLDKWMDAQTGSNDVGEHNAYATVPWVYRCVRLRSNALSAVPYHIKKGEDSIDYPLDYMLPRLLWLIEASLCVYGAAYLLREKNRAKVEGYRWLLPTSIALKTSEDRGLTGFTRTVGTRKTEYKPEELVYFWEPHLAAEVGPGISPVKAALTAANMGRFANEFAESFFRRGAVPLTLLTVEGNPGPEEKKRLEGWWDRVTKGIERAWATVAISASVKFQTITPPVKDMAMRELTTAARQQIAVALGIPQTMIEDAANYATAESHRVQFYENTIIPECGLVAQALNEQVFKPQGLEFKFLPEQLDIMQVSENDRAASLGSLTTAGVPLVLAMQMLGYDLPEDWTYERLEEMLHPKPTAPAPTTPGAPTPAVPGQEPTQPGERPMSPEMIEAQLNPSPAVLAQREHMRQLGASGILSARADLKRWRRKVQAHNGAAVEFESDDIPEHVQDLVRDSIETLGTDAFMFLKAPPEGQAATEAAIKKIIAQILALHIQDVVEAVMAGDTPGLDALKQALLAALLSRLVGIVTEQALRAAAEVGVSFDPAVISAGALRWAQGYTYELVTGIIDTTRNLISSAVQTFISTPGMNQQELRALLEPTFGEVRAEMIATTEVTRAYARASTQTQELLKEAGILMTRIWKTSQDEIVAECPICFPLEGKPESEWAGEFPGGPPAHVNCILPGQIVAVPGLSAGAKSFYSGRVIEITTSAGRRITVTQNHPILTAHGWVAAEGIREGSDVIGAVHSERMASCIYPDYDHRPAPIEEVLHSLAELSGMFTVSVPSTAEDLHGDGRFVNGKIDIIRPGSKLLSNMQAAKASHGHGFDHLLEAQLGGRGAGKGALMIAGAHHLGIHAINASATSGMGRGSELGALPWAGAGHAGEHTLGAVATGDAAFAQNAGDHVSADTSLARDFLLRNAGLIESDKVVSVREYDFAGHVYDLQSDLYGLYTCNGIVVKNCRCWTTLQLVKKP